MEAVIEAPAAPPASILELVANMSTETVEAPRNLSLALVNTLNQVAEVHDGSIPLHSRLFAQWLHYAFPQECPYPHMRGKIAPLTPSEWFDKHGRANEVSEDELAETFGQELQGAEGEEHAYMSQWTFDEEIRTSWPAEKVEIKAASGGLFATARNVLRTVAFILGPVSCLIYLVGSSGKMGWAMVFGASK